MLGLGTQEGEKWGGGNGMVKGPTCDSAHPGTGEDGAAKRALTADRQPAHYGGL